MIYVSFTVPDLVLAKPMLRETADLLAVIIRNDYGINVVLYTDNDGRVIMRGHVEKYTSAGPIANALHFIRGWAVHRRTLSRKARK